MMKQKIKYPTQTLLRHKCNVFNVAGVKVGWGYIYYRWDGAHFPELYTSDGNLLPDGNYNMELLEVEPELIIVSNNIH